MADFTLKSLHTYLKLLENPAELKRRIPANSNIRTLKVGMAETSRLVGLDESVFKDPQYITALLGAPRFIMIQGEPSASDQVTRAFDGARVLLTTLIDPARSENPTARQIGAGHQQGGAMAARSTEWELSKDEPAAAGAPVKVELEIPFDSLKPLLAGNTALTCRFLRVLFEHLLAFALQSSAPQGGVSLVNDLTGSKEHSRSFLSTALFVLGAEIDRDNLIPYMMQQGLFGLPVFESLLQNRDYCDAYYTFRRLERAFVGAPEAEEAQLRQRLNQINAQFGGKPYEAMIFEADEQDKVKIDAYLAATDLLEVLALTPWGVSLAQAVSLASSNSIHSVSIIARQFERFSKDDATRDQANREITDHLLAFARQFSADNPHQIHRGIKGIKSDSVKRVGD